MRGYVSSTDIISGKSFRINPLSTYIAANITKSGGTVTVDRLDKAAQQLGIGDVNNDGVVNHADILAFRMQNASPAKDAIQPFLTTLHS